MKKIIIALSIIFVAFSMKGQTAEQRLEYAATIGTGISMNEPAYTPLILQGLVYYLICERFWAGVGTGFSFYEMMLIPVFADAKFAITRPRKFTPYVECGIGYAFAPNNKANGGFYLNPSFGIQYALPNKMKLQFAAGYELQKAERLKEHVNDYFSVGFVEELSHNSLSVKVGVLF